LKTIKFIKFNTPAKIYIFSAIFLYIATNLIQNFMAVTLYMKLVIFCEKHILQHWIFHSIGPI